MFEIIHDESVKVYLHRYNGNVQQNPLCVESCVTKEFSMSPLLSSTIFDPDANSVLLRARLCTAADSKRRKPCVRNCSRKREGLINGNVQQNPLCAASCVTKDVNIFPRFSPAFFYRDANSVLLLAHLCTTVSIDAPARLEAHYARNNIAGTLDERTPKKVISYFLIARQFLQVHFTHKH